MAKGQKAREAKVVQSPPPFRVANASGRAMARAVLSLAEKCKKLQMLVRRNILPLWVIFFRHGTPLPTAGLPSKGES
jgi:hypothetical protein